MENNNILDTEIDVQNAALKRRDLIPMWIKVFIWIFMALGVFAPVGIVLSLVGVPFYDSLYGLETGDALSLMGLFITSLLIFKGISAYGLWTGKDWAIDIAQIDAKIGIAICLFVTFASPFMHLENGFIFNLRLELALLFPYLWKLKKIHFDW